MDTYTLSFVIPVYNEGRQIYKNIIILTDLLSKNNINHEIILVDDGSRDNSWEEISKLCNNKPGIRAFRLSRNFGKESALCAGLDAVNSDACVVMDADLQHPPELIPEMIRLWQEEGYDVVEGVKMSRGKERIVNKLGAHLFYDVLYKLSGFDLNSASDFKLFNAKVLHAYRQMGEHNTFFRGMSEWVGFKRKKIPFHVADRTEGTTKWPVTRLVKLAITAITSFSSIPLHIVTILGIMFLIGSIILGIHTIYMKVSGGALSGFTTVILLQLIIGSTLMISLGIIGTYIAKIFDEVKNRPRYLISQTVQSSKSKM
ncbi:MAG: glycosyltransferase family 2 protein [Clostridiaceae bacterium]|nr:glycosyltransferase family 2 protein [Clostridiaceae bacterium]